MILHRRLPCAYPTARYSLCSTSWCPSCRNHRHRQHPYLHYHLIPMVLVTEMMRRRWWPRRRACWRSRTSRTRGPTARSTSSQSTPCGTARSATASSATRPPRSARIGADTHTDRSRKSTRNYGPGRGCHCEPTCTISKVIHMYEYIYLTRFRLVRDHLLRMCTLRSYCRVVLSILSISLGRLHNAHRSFQSTL